MAATWADTVKARIESVLAKGHGLLDEVAHLAADVGHAVETVAPVAAAVDPNTPFTAMAVFRPSRFLPVLGIVYGGAYALNYIAMSRIEASRMALITRSAIVFTALYMVAMALLLHYGSIPSIVQAPAALLVISGSYLASHRRTREGAGGPGEGRVRGGGTGRLSRLRR